MNQGVLLDEKLTDIIYLEGKISNPDLTNQLNILSLEDDDLASQVSIEENKINQAGSLPSINSQKSLNEPEHSKIIAPPNPPRGSYFLHDLRETNGNDNTIKESRKSNIDDKKWSHDLYFEREKNYKRNYFNNQNQRNDRIRNNYSNMDRNPNRKNHETFNLKDSGMKLDLSASNDYGKNANIFERRQNNNHFSRNQLHNFRDTPQNKMYNQRILSGQANNNNDTYKKYDSNHNNKYNNSEKWSKNEPETLMAYPRGAVRPYAPKNNIKPQQSSTHQRSLQPQNRRPNGQNIQFSRSVNQRMMLNQPPQRQQIQINTEYQHGPGPRQRINVSRETKKLNNGTNYNRTLFVPSESNSYAAVPAMISSTANNNNNNGMMMSSELNGTSGVGLGNDVMSCWPTPNIDLGNPAAISAFYQTFLTNFTNFLLSGGGGGGMFVPNAGNLSSTPLLYANNNNNTANTNNIGSVPHFNPPPQLVVSNNPLTFVHPQNTTNMQNAMMQEPNMGQPQMPYADDSYRFMHGMAYFDGDHNNYPK